MPIALSLFPFHPWSTSCKFDQFSFLVFARVMNTQSTNSKDVNSHTVHIGVLSFLIVWVENLKRPGCQGNQNISFTHFYEKTTQMFFNIAMGYQITVPIHFIENFYLDCLMAFCEPKREHAYSGVASWLVIDGSSLKRSVGLLRSFVKENVLGCLWESLEGEKTEQHYYSIVPWRVFVRGARIKEFSGEISHKQGTKPIACDQAQEAKTGCGGGRQRGQREVREWWGQFNIACGFTDHLILMGNSTALAWVVGRLGNWQQLATH